MEMDDPTDMSHPEQIVFLAQCAASMDVSMADAAVLLTEAAAMCALECNLSLPDLVARLERSHATLAAASEAVDAYEKAAERVQ